MKKNILLVLTILFGLMMVNGGLNKFFNYMPMPEISPEMMKVLMAYGTVAWILPLVGLIEVIGGILIAIPKVRALGAIIILPITTGIVIHHAVHDIAGIGIGLILFLINIWVIIDSREKYLPLIGAAEVSKTH